MAPLPILSIIHAITIGTMLDYKALFTLNVF